MPTRKTTKAAPKTTAAKVSAPKKTTTPKVTSSVSKFNVKNLILPAIVVVIVVLLGIFRGQFIVATVNGEQISRLTLIKDLEKKDGKTELDNLITEKLILQEAKKRNVTVSDAEINTEISNIQKSVEAQGQKLDTLLAAQGLSNSDLKEQVKIQLMLKKMVGTASVTDKEISDYVAQNKDSIPAGTDEATINSQVKQQIQQQKNDASVQKLISDLQAKAKIDYLLKF